MILLVLIALVARVDAAPGSAATGSAATDPALQYADAWSRATQTAVLDEEADHEGDGERDDEDRTSRRAAIDDGENSSGDDEDVVDRGVAIDGELALADEIAPADASSLGDIDRSGERAAADAMDTRASASFAADDSASAELGLDDDAGALAGLGLGDDAAGGGAVGAGALAMLDAELAPGDEVAGLDAADAGATAGAEETYEQWMRHRRPSPWGRLDVGVSWRRRWSEPVHTPAIRYDEIWLVATWRR